MKKLIYLAAILAVTACGQSKTETADTDTQKITVDTALDVVNPIDTPVQESAVAEEAPAAEDNFAAQEKVARELYTKCVFGSSTSTLKKLCTQSMLSKLKAANEYDDGGYAVWTLRTGVQDGDGPSKVTSITPDGEDAVIVKYKDMGTPGSTRLLFVREGDTWKVNGATSPSGKKIL